MPTYQYACTACHHQLEAVQSFTDDPLTECPVCDGRLRKLFGSVGVVFKGPGFYRTDSRAASNGNGKGMGSNGSSGKGKDAESADGGKGGGKGTGSGGSGSDSPAPSSSGTKDKTAAGTGTS